MTEPETLHNAYRSSITSSRLFENVTMEDIEKQAMEIVKTRAEVENQERQDEKKTQRAVMTRRLSGLARSFSNSLTATRGTLKRTFSTSSQNGPRIPTPATAAPVPLTREQERNHRQALHTRLLAILTTTVDPNDVITRLVTMYMSPDFPPFMFDELLSLRILESITVIITPASVSMNLFASPAKPQALNNAFKEARKESEDHTCRLWSHLCRARVGRGEKEPSSEIRAKVVSLGIMAVMWPRGVTELGFRDQVWGRCEADSWGFNFCRRPGKDTLGCGLFMFLRGLGMWDEERDQPRPGDLRQNGIEVLDFAMSSRSLLR